MGCWTSLNKCNHFNNLSLAESKFKYSNVGGKQLELMSWLRSQEKPTLVHITNFTTYTLKSKWCFLFGLYNRYVSCKHHYHISQSNSLFRFFLLFFSGYCGLWLFFLQFIYIFLMEIFCEILILHRTDYNQSSDNYKT